MGGEPEYPELTPRQLAECDQLEAAAEGWPVIRLELTVKEAMMIISQLMLAATHPRNDGCSARWAESCVARLRDALPPEAQPLIDKLTDKLNR